MGYRYLNEHINSVNDAFILRENLECHNFDYCSLIGCHFYTSNEIW